MENKKILHVLDHDLHIHSQLSLCSNDPEQNPEAILAYAKENGFSHVCLTDHFWDERVAGASNWYQKQGYAHITKAKPLPQAQGVTFHFGCETDFDQYMTVGVSQERMEELEFIIIPTTHMHMPGFTRPAAVTALDALAQLWVSRIEGLLAQDLPFHKIGLAHMTCPLLAPEQWEDHLTVLSLISDDTMRRLFDRAAQKGLGIELNFSFERYAEEGTLSSVLRPYRLAKECGCRFYFGGDAHHPKDLLGLKERFTGIAQALELTQADIFQPFV